MNTMEWIKSLLAGLVGGADGDIATFRNGRLVPEASTSIVPTAVTVANEATDTTCFVVFVTAATGSLGPKTNANLAFDSNTGIATFGAASRFTTNASPVSNDGAALGTTALGWSDLHLATGALINVANGNAVITHSSGIFTVSTGDLRVTTAGTDSASVATVGGTQTLTAKTLTAPSIAGATLTGVIDAGGADSFEVPNSAAPTVNADGEIALDTTVADFSHGLLRVYGGEEQFIISLPVAALASPTNAYVIAYNSTNDEFELVAQTAGSESAANKVLRNLAFG